MDESLPELTAESPLSQRLKAYLDERFPLAVNGPAILLTFSTAFLVGARLGGSNLTIAGPRAVLGLLVLFCFFLRLRISDEHKDAAYDRVVNPERLVVRGVVTLEELRMLAGITLAIEAVCALLLGRAAVNTWAAAAGWSWLMHEEFFAPEWLRARPGVYMLTHMTVIPLLNYFCFACARPRAWAPGMFTFALAAAFATASLETARKIRLPRDEAPGVDTYSSAWGFPRSIQVVVVMQLTSFGLIFFLAGALHLGLGFYGLLWLSLMFVSWCLQQYAQKQDERFDRKLDKVAALYFLLLDLGLTVSLWQ